jgi:hypothetical protein
MLNSASYNSALTPVGIATGYGSDFAVASGTPTTVTVRDNSRTTRAATLVYMRIRSKSLS